MSCTDRWWHSCLGNPVHSQFPSPSILFFFPVPQCFKMWFNISMKLPLNSSSGHGKFIKMWKIYSVKARKSFDIQRICVESWKFSQMWWHCFSLTCKYQNANSLSKYQKVVFSPPRIAWLLLVYSKMLCKKGGRSWKFFMLYLGKVMENLGKVMNIGSLMNCLQV